VDTKENRFNKTIVSGKFWCMLKTLKTYKVSLQAVVSFIQVVNSISKKGIFFTVFIIILYLYIFISDAV